MFTVHSALVWLYFAANGCVALGDKKICDKTTDLSFSVDISPILEGSCKNCHSGYHNDDLYFTYQGAVDNYETAQKNGDPGIRPQVADRLMPKFGELDECEIEIITNWGEEGFPQ